MQQCGPVWRVACGEANVNCTLLMLRLTIQRNAQWLLLVLRLEPWPPRYEAVVTTRPPYYYYFINLKLKEFTANVQRCAFSCI
jgi:hypothetical protein